MQVVKGIWNFHDYKKENKNFNSEDCATVEILMKTRPILWLQKLKFLCFIFITETSPYSFGSFCKLSLYNCFMPI